MDFLDTVLSRLRRAATTVPTRRDGLELAVVLAIVAGVAGPFGLFTGLLYLDPKPLAAIARAAAIAFFLPALGEEFFFRAALIPDHSEAPRALKPILISTALFTAWHVVETLWLPAERTLFTRPDFLAWAAWLGLGCAILRRRSGSIWPPVILHWVTVVIWIGWLGGTGLG